MDYAKLETVMRRLALEAGDKIMEIYNSDDFEVKTKSDASPVTEADEAADALISAGLRAAFPDVTLVTEEQAATHAETATTFLIVDPLDGTKEFVNRRGDFTVNIGWVENGVPVRGVVYAPARDRMFYTLADGSAVEEFGPFDKNKVGEVKPIRVAEALGAEGKGARAPEGLDAYREALAAQKAALGERHPSTTLTMNNLASLLRSQERLPEAIELFSEALAAQREELGSLHQTT
ncbi:MAG: inositol monophosphatase family protein, partial [Pseudomonadota bacterium]|nr:inositol monophosphatase family protein [Pseudomonadota bacterium]